MERIRTKERESRVPPVNLEALKAKNAELYEKLYPRVLIED